MIPSLLNVTLGVIGGLGLLAAVFWFAFARMPSRRSDRGLTQHEATNYWAAYNDVDGGGCDQRD
jgi:hypothetical protein